MKKVLNVLSNVLAVLRILKNKAFLKALAALIVAISAVFGANVVITDEQVDAVHNVVIVADNVGSSLLPSDIDEIAVRAEDLEIIEE